MTEKVSYELNKTDFEEAITKCLAGEVEERIFNRFYNVLIDAKTVAKIHNVHPLTVSRYIKDGLITPEGKKGDRIFEFRLSYALKLDFHQLRKQLRGLN